MVAAAMAVVMNIKATCHIVTEVSQLVKLMDK